MIVLHVKDIVAVGRTSYRCFVTQGLVYRRASSLGQKVRDMTDEELRVLVLRAVIGVGVDDQLRVRDVLLHDERVHRGHECWLLDRLQIVVGRVFGATSNRSMRTVSRGKYR